MIFAIIKNNVIVNTIILEDEQLADHFKQDNDAIVRVDQLNPTPGIGWSVVNGSFVMPVPQEN